MLIRRAEREFLKGAPHSQFATAFRGQFLPESGELLFTNAGHPPPLWYRAAAGSGASCRLDAAE
jgi:serine phosphatase RsbU (regulator of sigma subunit)